MLRQRGFNSKNNFKIFNTVDYSRGITPAKRIMQQLSFVSNNFIIHHLAEGDFYEKIIIG
jgi:hypothetical protein